MAAKSSSASKAKKAPAKKGAKPKKLAPKAKPAKPATKIATKAQAPKPIKPVVSAKKPMSPPVVTSNNGAAKAKKPEAPRLTKADLTHFRDLLLEKRRDILGDVGSMESEAFKAGSNLSNMPIHMADVGTDNFEQEFTLGLIESERQILRDIQEALVRIDNGTFGVCLGTGKAIPKVRLEAVPWAKYTIEYSRLLESGKIERDNGSSSEEESSGGGSEDDEE